MQVTIKHQQTNQGFETCIQILMQGSEKSHTVRVDFQGMEHSIDIRNNDAPMIHNVLHRDERRHYPFRNSNAHSFRETSVEELTRDLVRKAHQEFGLTD